MSAAVADMIARAQCGDRRALSQLVSIFEQAMPEMRDALALLQPHLGRALTLGITGPPGAGKSTLVDALAQRLAARDETIGIVAVDPSSPVSGGAILGDRIRMSAALGLKDVFMRSLASRGALGGLSPAAVRLIDALDGAGMSRIIVETVGTGQNEIDVAEVTDIRVVLAAPGLGDGIQAMKSGLLEIADILVVNQADRPGADQTQQQLLSALSLAGGTRAHVPVLKTVATSGAGVDGLIATVDTLAVAALAVPGIERRRRRARYLIARAAGEQMAARVKRGGAAIDRHADDVLAGRATAIDVAAKLLGA